MDNSYDVKHDVLFTMYIKEQKITLNSIDKYANELNKLCKANDMTLTEFVDKCKQQQSYEKKIPIKIDNNGVEEYFIERFDINSPNSFIKIGMDNYISLCLERGNSNTNINNSVMVIRAVLNNCGVYLPKWKPYEDDIKDWEVLTKEDFIFVLNDCSLNHKALITFMLSSGMRISDCLNWTIGDFMEATSDYHNFNDVNEFIDNAPNDMIGYWDFYPQKTRRYNSILCKTCNSTESSNYILQNLRRIKNEYLPDKSRRIHKELELSKKDYLFGSRHKMYKGQITVKGISEQFRLKNKKLKEWRISEINRAIKNGEISKEDFDEAVAKIPRFHAHGCRKYFTNVLDKKCPDSRLRTLMEGHKPLHKYDPSYIKKAKKEVMETYEIRLLDCLTLENVESKKISEEVANELQNEIDSLRSQLDEVKGVSDKYKEEIWEKIYKYRLSHSKNFIRKDMVLCQYAFEHAIEDIFNFRDDSAYIEELFDYANAINDMYPNRFDETYKKAKSNFKGSFISSELKKKVTKILIASSNYGSIEKLVKKDYKGAEKKVLQVLENMDLTLEDLDDSELVREILSKAILGIA